DAQRNVVATLRNVVQQTEARRNEKQRTLDRLISRIELQEADRERLSEQLSTTQSSQTELFNRRETSESDLQTATARVASQREKLAATKTQEAALRAE